MRLRLFVLAALLGGCGDGGTEPVYTTLLVWNRSQFELLEVRVHADKSYDAAPNLLEAPLAPEEDLLVDFHTGEHVTVIRPQTELGETLALTTVEGLDIYTEGYTLIVFDESFRLVEPAR